MYSLILKGYLAVKTKIHNFMSNERGDASVIAVIMIIVIVIALVAIFKDGITKVVNGLMTKITESVGGAVSGVESGEGIPIG